MCVRFRGSGKYRSRGMFRLWVSTRVRVRVMLVLGLMLGLGLGLGLMIWLDLA